MLNTELTRYLQRNNVSQRAFAKFLGVTPRTVSNWVSGTLLLPKYVQVVVALLPEDEAAIAIRSGVELPHFEAWESLGISPEASKGEAKMAYRRLSSRVHPDKGGTDELMCRVNWAYEVFQ
jgi:transcriptional regulator with XRE-family HTH domain